MPTVGAARPALPTARRRASSTGEVAEIAELAHPGFFDECFDDETRRVSRRASRRSRRSGRSRRRGSPQRRGDASACNKSPPPADSPNATTREGRRRTRRCDRVPTRARRSRRARRSWRRRRSAARRGSRARRAGSSRSRRRPVVRRRATQPSYTGCADEPITNEPPWNHTSTGRAARRRPAGAQRSTSSKRARRYPRTAMPGRSRRAGCRVLGARPGRSSRRPIVPRVERDREPARRTRGSCVRNAQRAAHGRRQRMLRPGVFLGNWRRGPGRLRIQPGGGRSSTISPT